MAYNETGTHCWCFTETISWLKVTNSSLDKLDEVLGTFEIKRLPRIGPAAGREGVFLHRRIRWNESGFSY